VFTTDRDGNLEIYKMDNQGKGLTNLSRHPAPTDAHLVGRMGVGRVFYKPGRKLGNLHHRTKWWSAL